MTIKKFLKKIEYGFGKLLYFILGLFVNNKEYKGKIDISKIKKTLIVRHDVVGDMLVTMPMFKYLKLLNPEIEIHVLGSRSNLGLLDHDNNIRKVFTYEPKFFKRLALYEKMRAEAYDLIIVAYALNLTKTGLMLHQISCPNTIKAVPFKKTRHKIFFNKMIPVGGNKLNEWEKLKVLATELFEQKVDFDFSLYLNTDDITKKVVDDKLSEIGLLDQDFFIVNLTAAQQRHTWTKEGYKQLLDNICTKKNKKLLLSFMEPEREFANELLARDSSGNLYLYPGSKTLIEVGEMVSRSKLVVTPDTGFVHFASAMKIPIVGLYMNWHSNKPWMPVGVPYRFVIAKDGSDISTINARDVINALDELIDEIF